MQQTTWLMGIKALVLAFPDRDQTEAVQNERGRLYQQHLADLTDEQWRYAVQASVQRERWFPTIAMLRDYAAEVVPRDGRWDPVAGRAAVQRALATVRQSPGERARAFLERVGGEAEGFETAVDLQGGVR